MIAGWLAGKVSGLIIFAIACLSVVLIPAVIVQTVRIDGLDIFGWYAVKGYRPMYLQDEIDLGTLRHNQATLQTGIATCNASVEALKKAGDARTADADARVKAAEEKARGLQSAIDRMKRIPSTKEVCPTADAILNTGLQ